MLYQMDLTKIPPKAAIRFYWSNLGEPAPDDIRQFADELVIGCTEKKEVIDQAIRSVSQNWRLERMPYVDRNIIRLAVYELLVRSDIPRNVTLNEAVELAKLFGDETSPSFINGVLDRIAFNLGKE